MLQASLFVERTFSLVHMIKLVPSSCHMFVVDCTFAACHFYISCL